MRGTAQAVIDVMVEGEMFDVEVKVSAEYIHDYEFKDEDIEIPREFEDQKDIVIRKIRMIEPRLNFIPENV